MQRVTMEEVNSEYSFTGDNFTVTQDMKRSFSENGYIIVRYI